MNINLVLRVLGGFWDVIGLRVVCVQSGNRGLCGATTEHNIVDNCGLSANFSGFQDNGSVWRFPWVVASAS